MDIRKNMDTPLLYHLFGVANGAIFIFNLDYPGLEINACTNAVFQVKSVTKFIILL